MTRTFFLIFLVFFSAKSFSQTVFKEIYTNGKIVPVSQISQIGKISVFIISADWCAPCKGLKKHLENTKFAKNVDFYYVEIANQEMKEFKESEEFKFWSRIEGLESFPLIYITAQSTNIIAKFSTESDNMYEKIIDITNSLNRDVRFNSKLIFEYDQSKKNITHLIKKKQKKQQEVSTTKDAIMPDEKIKRK